MEDFYIVSKSLMQCSSSTSTSSNPGQVSYQFLLSSHTLSLSHLGAMLNVCSDFICLYLWYGCLIALVLRPKYCKCNYFVVVRQLVSIFFTFSCLLILKSDVPLRHGVWYCKLLLVFNISLICASKHKLVRKGSNRQVLHPTCCAVVVSCLVYLVVLMLSCLE